MLPHRLTKTYVAALAAIFLFICTFQLFRSSPASSAASTRSDGWRDWMWPSYDDGEPKMITTTPPKFVRPPPNGEGSIPKDKQVEGQRWAEESATEAAISHEETPAPKSTKGEEKEPEKEHKEEEGPRMMPEADCPSHAAWRSDAFPALNTTFHVSDTIHHSFKGPDPSEVVLVTATDGKGHNGGIEDILGQTEANRRAYCEQHGYNYHFVNISKFELGNAHPVWKKIPAIVDAFNAYPSAKWVFFLDLDAIIMSPKQDLNSLVLSHEGMSKSLDFGAQYHGSDWSPLGTYMPESNNVNFDEIDMLVAQDHNGVNAGSFFLRRSKFTQWMLDMWADPFFMRMDWPGQEQDTLLHFIKHHKIFRQHLGLIKQRVANAYTEGNDAMRWQTGDLVVHFAGCWVADKCQERWQEFWHKKTSLEY